MSDPFIKDFANRIVALRQNKEVSAREMSISLGQNHNYMYNIEAGKNYPSMLMFFYICEYLGVTPREFFDYGNSNPVGGNLLSEEFHKLDKDTQEYFLGLMKTINDKKD